MDFFMDFTEGVRDFRVIGDPSVPAPKGSGLIYVELEWQA